MFSDILRATDGSEHADRALDYATRLADNERARLHVVHIVETIVGGRVAGQNALLNRINSTPRSRRRLGKSPASTASIPQST